LVALSGKKNKPLHQRIHYFIGGLSLSVTSLFTLFASIVYNFAIATTDTDLIMNAVIILFINDIDELMNDILIEIDPLCDSRGGGRG
jgi:hypothetical protein